jgi:hypothetical protein
MREKMLVVMDFRRGIVLLGRHSLELAEALVVANELTLCALAWRLSAARKCDLVGSTPASPWLLLVKDLSVDAITESASSFTSSPS